MKNIRYHKASSLADALALMQAYRTDEHCTNIRALAGGTDLIPTMKASSCNIDGIIELTDIDELKGIKNNDGTISIGTLTPFVDIVNSPIIEHHVPLLSKACSQIGSVQIRNRGTIGGNIVNASPSGDSIPALFVLDTTIHIAAMKEGIQHERKVKIDSFFTGPGKTLLEPGEILTAISFPAPGENSRSEFIKLGQRRAVTISKVSIAVLAYFDNQHISSIRIALGAVAPTVMRARKTEETLAGKSLKDSKSIEKALETIGSEGCPINDIRSHAWYRCRMISILLDRALKALEIA